MATPGSRAVPAEPLRRAIPLLVCLLAACGGGGDSGGGGGGGGGGTGPVVLSTAHAVWLDAGTLVWPGTSASYSYRLYYSASAALAPASTGVSGADNAAGDALTVGTLSAALQSQYPQYATAPALQVPAATQSQIAMPRDQLAIVRHGQHPIAGTPQMRPDAVFASAAPVTGLISAAPISPRSGLGATARSVKLNVYTSAAPDLDHPDPAGRRLRRLVLPAMQLDQFLHPTASTSSSWAGSGGDGQGARHERSDRSHSVSPSASSRYSMVLDRRRRRQAGGCPALIPAAAPTDSVIHLHLRDFPSTHQ
jgi:hypothetical protein